MAVTIPKNFINKLPALILSLFNQKLGNTKSKETQPVALIYLALISNIFFFLFYQMSPKSVDGPVITIKMTLVDWTTALPVCNFGGILTMPQKHEKCNRLTISEISVFI